MTDSTAAIHGAAGLPEKNQGQSQGEAASTSSVGVGIETVRSASGAAPQILHTHTHASLSPHSPQRSAASVSVRSVPNSPALAQAPSLPQDAGTPQAKPQSQHQHSPPLPAKTQAQAHVSLIDENGGLEIDSGMVLGLEQLERQQEEVERRRKQSQNQIQNRQLTTSNHSNPPPIAASATATTASQSQTEPRQQQAASVAHSQSQSLGPNTDSMPQQVTEQYQDDDENTASTITGNTMEHPKATSGPDEVDPNAAADIPTSIPTNKFGQILQSARKRITSKSPKAAGGPEANPAVQDGEDEDDDEIEDSALIYGHLQKLGRNGKWQTRWFETDGECLSYYKTRKRVKLLATLDLTKVGCIEINEDDPKGCTFTIQVLGRPYYLRAESKAACKDWVITLNRVKEARLEQGNVKLVAKSGSRLQSHQHYPPDLLDENVNVSEYTPRVVAVANRQRTRAVDGIDMNIESWEMHNGPHTHDQGPVPVEAEINDHPTDASTSSISQVVLAQWQKRRSKFSSLAQKLARWARSLKKLNCTEIESVRLDEHVHPPGHDDKFSSSKAQPEHPASNVNVITGLSSWIGKDGLQTTAGGSKSGPGTGGASMSSEEVAGSPIDNDSIQHAASAGSTSQGGVGVVAAVEQETRELS